MSHSLRKHIAQLTIVPCSLAPVPPLKTYDIGQIAHIGDPEVENDDEDGMGGIKYRYHRSEKILGKLYRSIDENRIWAKDIHTTIDTSGPSVWEQFLNLVRVQIEQQGLDVQYKRELAKAWRIRNM